jgi:hypothetical protein
MAVMEFIKSTDSRKKIVVEVLKRKSGCTKVTDGVSRYPERCFFWTMFEICGKEIRTDGTL